MLRLQSNTFRVCRICILADIFMHYIINEMEYDHKLFDIIIEKLNNAYKKLKIFDKLKFILYYCRLNYITILKIELSKRPETAICRERERAADSPQPFV